MNRRKFLRNGSVGAVALGTLSLASCETPDSKQKAAAGDLTNASVDATVFELNEYTIAMLQEKMKDGSMSARSITELYLRRIDVVDKKGPMLNSVIELNPDALAIADEMDKERKAGKVRGPLHGIPVLIKDNIDTGDKMMTTAGSLALLGHKAAKDAFIIQRLREAGAILLGKTNLSEWANFRSTRSTSGWSSRGGQTKNPCILDRNPCGSSSGSGAAVAANLCAVAIGTETDGSVIAPASFNGVVGIKPTVGLLSRSGIIPISKTQDTAGPMARTVTDAAILLGALTGIDPSDAVTNESKDKFKSDYSQALNKTALQGKRIGVEKAFMEGNPGVVAIYQQAIDLLKKSGATIVEVELLKACGKAGDAEFTLMQYEFKDGLNHYLASAGTAVKSLTDIIKFNKDNAATAMPYFKQETLEASDKKTALTASEYKDALSATTSCRKIIDDMMHGQQLDAIVGTSIGPANCTDLVNGDYGTGFYFCPPAAMAGYPHITVPMGTINDLPLGLSFIAGAYQEEKIIGLAYAFEQASLKRQAPKFLPTMKS